MLSDHGINVTCNAKGNDARVLGLWRYPERHQEGQLAAPGRHGHQKLAFKTHGPLGQVKTQIQALPYKVSVDSKTNSKGQTDGLISGVKVKVTMTGCQFMVTVPAPGFYTNSKHTLTMASKLPIKTSTKAQLTVSRVKRCAGVVKNGDHPTFGDLHAEPQGHDQVS